MQDDVATLSRKREAGGGLLSRAILSRDLQYTENIVHASHCAYC